MTETRAVLVTGSTGGIGTATVRLLRSRGFTVYAGARGPAEFEPGVRMVPLDVADPESVAAAAKRVAGEVDGLWAVINNAGVIVQGPLELVPADEWRRQLEVNTLGPASVVREFLPLVRAGHGRIVNVSAATGRVAMPLLGALSASKAGLEALSNALRLELAAWKIPVVVIEPGTTETEIFARAGAAADAAMQQADRDRVGLYQAHLAAYEKAMGRFKPGPVEKVAEVIVRAVESRRPRRRYAIAEARTLGAILPKLPPGLRDRALTTAVGLNSIKL
ncbi:SDR family NAD(P)-dependent oxidoreductase [Kribbella jiaozuonensis]|uniref:SDR family NAD(P)-dependent oxidoreductase n=1 Tax=Kribbella jiaozuonensis TaxID=2575441 RepID=A0A4U3LU14_9ACTN|nr:SDR family NAD(P)-dependent oxidoreductase [Kribbella jiaozuonensis]TKK78027.1 SDR family NAD(P)-dependent oxidoreductase [Kribbella jiaozuonensis]